MYEETKTLTARIEAFNKMYGLAVHNTPIFYSLTESRLAKFKSILVEEVNEIDDISVAAKDPNTSVINNLTNFADLLADVIVYCMSEAVKYGIPIEEVLQIVMDSNMSKLGEDGKPKYDERGKVLKGPNYWKPEDKIRELLISKLPPV